MIGKPPKTHVVDQKWSPICRLFASYLLPISFPFVSYLRAKKRRGRSPAFSLWWTTHN